MLNGVLLREFLLNEGVSAVGYADIDGLIPQFNHLNNAISLVLKLPKESIQAIIDDDYGKYWKIFHNKVDFLKKIAFKTENLIKDNGYDAFALTLERNECDMDKLLSILPYKTVATKSGLGWIGRSALFVTEDYGSAVTLCTILTDMPLEYGHEINDSYCDDCEECQNACPVNAINPTKWNSGLNREDIIDIDVCSEYVIDQVRAGLGCSKCLSDCKLTRRYFEG